MTVLLREHGIPARFVQGFLPGHPQRADRRRGDPELERPRLGRGLLPGPRLGHLRSDRRQASRRPSRCRRASRSTARRREPSRSLAPDDDGRTRRDRPRVARRSGRTTDRAAAAAPGAFIVIALLLLAVVGGIAFLAWQRGPRGPTTPEGVYAGVARLAARLGFGPRPTQTAYEYATALGDVLPNVRPELQTVATAKVEVAYGRRTLGDDRIRALRDSYRRLRVGLLRLAVPARAKRRAALAVGLERARTARRSSPRPPGPPRRGAARGARSGSSPGRAAGRRGSR